MYNNDLHSFQEHRINEYVSDFFRANGYRLSEDNNSSITAINLSLLLPELISIWFKDKKDIEFISSENSVRISITMGHADIAITDNNEDRNRIIELINELRDFDLIKRELDKFYQAVMDIYNKSEKLSKDIGKNIIRFIELEEYDKICKICEP